MSTLSVCKGVNLNNKYEHTIFFSSQSERDTYFDAKVDMTFDNMSYLRKQWNVKVQSTYANARNWTYAFTVDGSHPRYYYFITDIKYINDATVELVLELDVMTTYIHTYKINKSFVERMHVTNDTIGTHTVDEGLDVGDIITYLDATVPLNSMAILILSSIHPTQKDADGNPLKVYGQNADGVFSGLGVYAVQFTDWKNWAVWLDEMSKNGTIENILTMWMYPKSLLQIVGDWGDQLVMDVNGVEPLTVNYHRRDTLGGYTPRNNKLYCYPYNFLYMTNNSGSSAVFRYERFGDPSSINFRLTGALSPADSVRMYPLNYNGEQHAYEYGMTLGAFPTCAWNSDTYKLWLAQNQNQQGLSYATAGVKIAGGLIASVGTSGLGAMGGVASIGSGISDIMNLLAQKSDREIQPSQAKGSYSASVNMKAGFQSFSVKYRGITPEFAKIIDDYFDMYGYKINKLTLPMIHAREAWSYVKTVGANVTGNVPMDDLIKIKSIYDAGVTFWVDGDKIGDYSQSNKPI